MRKNEIKGEKLLLMDTKWCPAAIFEGYYTSMREMNLLELPKRT